MLLTCSISWGMPKIISLVLPFCLVLPLVLSQRLTLEGSGMEEAGMNDEMGVKLSKPFAVDQGRPAFLTLSCERERSERGVDIVSRQHVRDAR